MYIQFTSCAQGEILSSKKVVMQFSIKPNKEPAPFDPVCVECLKIWFQYFFLKKK